MRSLNIAATGMLAQQTNVEVISNNIANMNTTSFKKQRAEFQDLLYQDHRRVGSASSDTGTIVPAGVQIGVGVKTAGVYRITEQGNLVSTNNTYDVAIQGKGFFQVTLPNGDNAYTRAGSFQLSASLMAGEGTGPEHRLSISGRIYDVTRVPVLTRTVRRGEKIGPGDVAVRLVRAESRASGANLDIKDVIGKTPRRALRRGAMLHAGDIQEPVIVVRGKLVTIVLKTRNMVITARGKALEDGAMGDLIRVRNNRSKSTIEGVVAGPARVTIDIPG